MRPRRTLSLATFTAIAALAVIPAIASAEIEVSSETSGEHCPAVTLNGHHVEGGCHIEMVSVEHKVLVAFVPQRVALSTCDLHVEARVGEDGEGWITAASFTNEDPPVNPPCTRAPCDEANGAMIPWPIHISENAPGAEEGESTFCFRTIPSGPGGAMAFCEMHLAVTEIADHEYDIGGSGTEMCEVSTPPVGIENFGFVYEDGSERIEVVH